MTLSLINFIDLGRLLLTTKYSHYLQLVRGTSWQEHVKVLKDENRSINKQQTCRLKYITDISVYRLNN